MEKHAQLQAGVLCVTRNCQLDTAEFFTDNKLNEFEESNL